jgi:uncharacterized protein (TIGR03437 family)
VAPGAAKVSVTAGGVTQSAANVQIAKVAPALYTLNGSGLAAAGALRVSADGTQNIELAYTLNSAGSFSASPIDMGSASDNVYLQLAGTGLQAAGTAGVKVTVGGLDAPVLFVGPQGSFGGLDQVDVQLPAALAGQGNVNVQVTAAGIAANSVQITIK